MPPSPPLTQIYRHGQDLAVSVLCICYLSLLAYLSNISGSMAVKLFPQRAKLGQSNIISLQLGSYWGFHWAIEFASSLHNLSAIILQRSDWGSHLGRSIWVCIIMRTHPWKDRTTYQNYFSTASHCALTLIQLSHSLCNLELVNENSCCIFAMFSLRLSPLPLTVCKSKADSCLSGTCGLECFLKGHPAILFMFSVQCVSFYYMVSNYTRSAGTPPQYRPCLLKGRSHGDPWGLLSGMWN